jgi:3-ketosteroid 9alpha-monooxygenase subunit A
MLKLSMKPTGWFQIGWSAEFPAGTAHPLRYFSQDLVAFRSESGVLSVLDAHCRHLGAHLGHPGKVNGDCVVCPYHGWEWDGQGTNQLVPYQDQPTKARIRSWAVAERNGIVWLWHDPTGGAPRPEITYPDVFGDFKHLVAEESDYYPCFPEAIVSKLNEAIHPQLVLENSADCTHFKYAHSAAEFPRLESFNADTPQWEARLAFLSPKTKEASLFLDNRCYTIGVTAAMFNGKGVHYRLVLTATPVDENVSDLRVSYFLPRNGDTGDTLPPKVAEFAKSTEELFEQDARIWRHQAFVQKPIYALADRAGYSALRTWCEQFFEAPEGQHVVPVVDES